MIPRARLAARSAWLPPVPCHLDVTRQASSYEYRRRKHTQPSPHDGGGAILRLVTERSSYAAESRNNELPPHVRRGREYGPGPDQAPRYRGRREARVVAEMGCKTPACRMRKVTEAMESASTANCWDFCSC